MDGLTPLLLQADQAIVSRNFFLAKRLVMEALEEDPDNAGEYDSGRGYLLESVRLEPENSYTFYMLARLEGAAGRTTDAYGWISKALELDPMNAEYFG
jgi:tetratricopeptide (TPR) repeat protein